MGVGNPLLTMPKGGIMDEKTKLKPDIVLKEYWRRNEEFADLFNAYLYGGREVIKPETLLELDTESSEVLTIGDKEVAVQAERDIIKSIKIFNGVEYAVLAIENQAYIQYALPIVIGGYDFYSYSRQLKARKEQHKIIKDLQGDELMSGIKKTDRFAPIVTIVLYYGRKSWDGPVSLHDTLEIPEELKAFVPEYKVKLIEIKNHNLDLKNKNNRDLFTLLKYIYNNRGRKEAENFIKDYDKNNHLDISVIRAIAATTGSKTPLTKEEIKMDQFWEDVKEMGKQEGLSEGISQGDEIRLIRMICKKLQKNVSIPDISEMLEEEESRVEEIVNAAKSFAPNYDVNEIYKVLNPTLRTV